MLIPGFEKLGSGPKSKLGLAIESELQKLLDFKEENSGNPKKVRLVNKMMKDTVAPAILKHIRDYTGIPIRKMVLSSSPDGMFAVSLAGAKSTKQDMVETIMNVADGISNENMARPKTAKALRDAFESPVLKNIKVDPKKVAEFFDFDFYFDVHMHFLSKETVHMSGIDHTAAEVTAGFLHETGHVFSMLRNSYAHYARATFLQSSFQYFEEHGSTAEKLEFLASAPAPKNAPKPINDLFGLVKTTAEKIQSLEKEGDGEELRVSKFIKICEILWQLYLTFVLQWIVFFGSALFDTASLLLLKDTEIRSKKKRGDVMTTQHNFMKNEREADEYCQTHGYGGENASGLIKCYTNWRLGGFNSKATRNSNAVIFMIDLENIFMALLGVSHSIVTVYEGRVERLQRIKQNMIKQLKGLPPGQIDQVVEQIESLQRDTTAYIKHKGVDKICRWAETAYTTIHSIANPASLADALLTAKLTNDYKKLFDFLDELRGNNLYYRSAKLDQLSRT